MTNPDDQVFESLLQGPAPSLNLRCEIEGDELVIRVSAACLAFAAKYLSDDADEMHYLKVHDPTLLLVDVHRELKRDDDGGGSLIEQLFDTVIVNAAENGSLAFADEPSPTKTS